FGQRRDHVVHTVVNALDGAADRVLRAGSLAAAEGGVVLVLVDADAVRAVLRREQHTAGTGRAAGAKDHVRALADELFSRRRAAVRSNEAVDVHTQRGDVGVDVASALL